MLIIHIIHITVIIIILIMRMMILLLLLIIIILITLKLVMIIILILTVIMNREIRRAVDGMDGVGRARAAEAEARLPHRAALRGAAGADQEVHVREVGAPAGARVCAS